MMGAPVKSQHISTLWRYFYEMLPLFAKF